MTDYYAQVHGNFGQGSTWSFGLNITSNRDLPTMLAAWSNAWNLAWADATNGLESLYPTTTKIDRTTVSQVDSAYRQTQKRSNTENLVGTSTSDTLPFQEAIVVSLRSDFVGPKTRGRFYLPAMAEDAVNGDILVLPAQTRVKGAVMGGKQAIEADGSTFFVVDKKKVIPPLLPPIKYVITSFEVSNKPARQSRRTRKIKPSYL